MASLTPTRVSLLGKRNTLSGLAIGMTVLGCLLGALIIAAVLWLFCSTWGRRDTIPVQKTVTEPTKSKYGQPWIDLELGRLKATPPPLQESWPGTREALQLQQESGPDTRVAPQLQKQSTVGGFRNGRNSGIQEQRTKRSTKKKNRAATANNSKPPPVMKRPLPTATKTPVPARTKMPVVTERGRR